MSAFFRRWLEAMAPRLPEFRTMQCPECHRVSSVAPWCGRPICVHSWEGNAGHPEIWDGDNADGEGRRIEDSPHEPFRTPGPKTWTEMFEVRVR